MAQKSKRLEKIAKNPRAVRFSDLVRVAEEYGATAREGKGSHFVLSWEGKFPIIVPRPHGNSGNVGVPYVRAVLERIEEIRFEESLDSGPDEKE